MMSLAPLNWTSLVSNFVLTTTVLAKVGSASAHNLSSRLARPQSVVVINTQQDGGPLFCFRQSQLISFSRLQLEVPSRRTISGVVGLVRGGHVAD